jgi:hypothetical protein
MNTRVVDLVKGADQEAARAWAWTFWEAELPIPAVCVDALAAARGAGKGDKGGKGGQGGEGGGGPPQIEIMCKATDTRYEVPKRVTEI